MRGAAVAQSMALVVLLGTAFVGVGEARGEDQHRPSGESVFVDLRIWQHIDRLDNLWLSARQQGTRWREHGTVRIRLDRRSSGFSPASHHRHADLEIAGVGIRIWQRVADPTLIFAEACVRSCPPRERGVLLPWTPLGKTALPLDDGYTTSGTYRYGDITVAIPLGNRGLLADREFLLALRSPLVGVDGRLNWNVDTDTSRWDGVSLSGTPARVTSLNLSGRGLNGEVWGWLGSLSALNELRLDGNHLGGLIPSKLGLLENLTHLFLGGNSFEGCVPEILQQVEFNDLSRLTLPDCPDLNSPEAAQTTIDFSSRATSGSFRFVFDRPPSPAIKVTRTEGRRFEFSDPGPIVSIFHSYTDGATIRNTNDEREWLFLGYDQREELERSHYSICSEACRTSDLSSLWIERLAASVWVDTNVTRSATFRSGDRLVYVDPPGDRQGGYYAPKIVQGTAIEICTDAYSNALTDAVELWNGGLQQHEPQLVADEVDVFADIGPCAPAGPARYGVEATGLVRVVARSALKDFGSFCLHENDRACTLFTSYDPSAFQYGGDPHIFVNTDRLPVAIDALDDLSDPGYRSLVRSLAQSLGHLLGLQSHACGNITADEAIESLMQCSDLAIAAFPDSWSAQLQQSDLEQYAQIYRPSLVGDRVADGEVKPFVSLVHNLVILQFEHRNVSVEDKLEIRRWGVPPGSKPGTEPSWILLKSYEQGRPNDSVVFRNQPLGRQRYGVFMTTHALLAGQCDDNDPDCDSTNNDEDWIPGEPIGFGRLAEIVVTR